MDSDNTGDMDEVIEICRKTVERQQETLRKMAQADPPYCGDRDMARKIAHDLKGARPFDIFFAYFHDDQDEVEVAKDELESHGYQVYTDYSIDPQWDPKEITRETVDGLRSRLRQCRSLFFGASKNSANSNWTPWELGYMDGFVGADRIFLFPLAETGVAAAREDLGFLKAYEENVVDRKHLRGFLARHLPKTGNPALDEPMIRIGDYLRTDNYRDWLKENAPRLTADPTSLMHFWSNLAGAYSHLTG